MCGALENWVCFRSKVGSGALQRIEAVWALSGWEYGIMKTKTLFSILAGGAMVSAGMPVTANAIQINIAASQDIAVVFDAPSDSFYFMPAVNQFQVTSVAGGIGDSVGLSGNITASFLIGDVTIHGELQTAPVVGWGTLTINNGANTLKADLVWSGISSSSADLTINPAGILNLANITYAGMNSDLMALASSAEGTAVVMFEFDQATSLTQLKDSGGQISFQGRLNSHNDPLAVPDTGFTLGLLGLALTGVETLRRRLQR
jgi:hypothetical protein